LNSNAYRESDLQIEEMMIGKPERTEAERPKKSSAGRPSQRIPEIDYPITHVERSLQNASRAPIIVPTGKE
jgi:hypothetical protein